MTPADRARAKAEACRDRAEGCQRTANKAFDVTYSAFTPESLCEASTTAALSFARRDTWRAAALEFDALAAELDAEQPTTDP